MKQNINQKQKIKIKPIVVLTSSVLLFLLILFAVLSGSIFNSNKSAAVTNIDFENGREYWMISDLRPSNFSSSLDIDIKSKFDGSLIVKLYSNKEDLLVKETMQIKKGDNLHTLQNLGLLPSGIYLLEVSGEDKTVQEQLVKP